LSFRTALLVVACPVGISAASKCGLALWPVIAWPCGALVLEIVDASVVWIACRNGWYNVLRCFLALFLDRRRGKEFIKGTFQGW